MSRPIHSPVTSLNTSIPFLPRNLRKDKEGDSSDKMRRFPIKPSVFAEGPCHGYTAQGLYRDKKVRLASEECQVRRRRMLKQLSRHRHAIEEKQGEKEHVEVALLMHFANEGLTYADLDPQNALRLARAARDVVLAEYRTAHIRVREGELHLETLKDAAEQAHATWCDANDQVNAIFSFCHREGIHIDVDPPHVPSLPAFDIGPLFPYLHSETDSVDSDTECEESSET